MEQSKLDGILEAHSLWLSTCGAKGKSADLTWSRLRRKNLSGANLFGAQLLNADLSGADLSGANLHGVSLFGVNLRGANLRGANLLGVNLRGASLRGVNLRGANLHGVNLRGANLRGCGCLTMATMPDGRTYEDYIADHFAWVCDDPEVQAMANDAWGGHEWGSCPMSAAHGWMSIDDAPEDRRISVACWLAMYDGGHLPHPYSQL